MRKTLTLVFILTIALSFSSCSSSKHVTKGPSAKKWKYFKILADADDDPIFVKLQDDLHIDPKMERYTVIIDIRSDDPGQQYILFGDADNPIRFQWSQVSPGVQKGLVNWSGNSKENLE